MSLRDVVLCGPCAEIVFNPHDEIHYLSIAGDDLRLLASVLQRIGQCEIGLHRSNTFRRSCGDEVGIYAVSEVKGIPCCAYHLPGLMDEARVGRLR